MPRCERVLPFIGLLSVGLLASATAFAQVPQAQPPEPSLALDDVVPFDPKVTKGQLENGLVYYIRENPKPEQRAELRLAVDVGSILEDDDQLGLAHFAEHMAFNGTRHFAKLELVDYLESIGTRFGADLNAYTSFDETVYMLKVPTDDVEIVKKAFQILEDWAHGVTFEGEEIDKERGVVIEEWRLGRGAFARIRDQQIPILFKNSLYAERLTIGEKEILESFEHDTLRRFYKDWYRPELMAVVAVGDFDSTWIEGLIREHFSRIPKATDARPRKVAPVPDHEETLFAIATDPELTQTSIALANKYELEPEVTVREYRRSLTERLFHGILSERLAERTQEPDPPFLGASSSGGAFVRSKGVYVLGAGVKDGGLERGLEALLTEAGRVREHGFLQSELDRQKTAYLRRLEQFYNERGKTQSRVYASEYIRNFLEDEPAPGIEYEFELAKKYVPGIELEEVNALAKKWITPNNRVVLVSAPEKEGVSIPDEEALVAVFRAVEDREIAGYEDKVADRPLIPERPEPGEIVSRQQIEELEVEVWQLSNGVEVILKPTDFKNDEVRFTSFSPGGHSLVKDEDHVAAMTAASVIQQGGLGKFDLIELGKHLTGKLVGVTPFISELTEGISGSASPDDLETMFQLIHLYFTAPRKDPSAYQSYLTRMQGFLANRQARPETVFRDTVRTVMSQNHFRRRPMSEELLEEMDLDKSFEIYRDRFADASDFTFFFVGAFDLEGIEPLVKTYLASLPSTRRVETWRDVGVEPPKGVIEKTVEKGLEEKSRVQVIFSGPFDWSRQNRYDVTSMAHLLRIKLRETLREELGGTYGVGVVALTDRYPDQEYRFSVSFSCGPDKVEELTAHVFEQIDKVKGEEISEVDLGKIKEIQRRGREIELKENGFWLSSLEHYYYHEEDPLQILTFNELVDGLSAEAVQKAATQYLVDNYVRVVLLPEGSGAVEGEATTN